MNWIHHKTVLLKEPAAVTLVVESAFCLVLTVRAYDMCVNFPIEVR
jgi:hypothetical protein